MNLASNTFYEKQTYVMDPENINSSESDDDEEEEDSDNSDTHSDNYRRAKRSKH